MKDKLFRYNGCDWFDHLQRIRRMKRKSVQIKKKKSGKKRAIGGLEVDPRNEEILSKIAVRKPKSHKGRKVVESREPQVHELPKVKIIIK